MSCVGKNIKVSLKVGSSEMLCFTKALNTLLKRISIKMNTTIIIMALIVCLAVVVVAILSVVFVLRGGK